jgi:hypothetical protein
MERLIKTRYDVSYGAPSNLSPTPPKREMERLRGMLNLEAHEGNSPAAQAAREWCRIYESVVMSEINKCPTSSGEFMKLSSNTRTPMKASFLHWTYGSCVQVAKSGRQYDCVCGLHGQIV